MIQEYDVGGSPVQKKLLEKNNRKYIMRKYNPKFMKGRYNAFEILKKINDVNISRLIENGNDYAIFEFIDGESLDKLLSNENSAFYASLVSKELKKLHYIDNYDIPIYEIYIRSIEKKINRIKSFGFVIPYLSIMTDYIEKYKEYLKKRKGSIIHGDFHPGNIVSDGSNIFLIDLDMVSHDDAFKDLVDIFAVNYSEFYNELFKNYFNYTIPDDFYIIYNLYSILLCLDYILYSKREFDSFEIGIKPLEYLMESTDRLRILKPNWIK